MSTPEDAPRLVVDPSREGVGKDGQTIQFATRESIAEVLRWVGVEDLIGLDARWGENTGELTELLSDCPVSHLEPLVPDGIAAYAIGAVTAATEGTES